MGVQGIVCQGKCPASTTSEASQSLAVRGFECRRRRGQVMDCEKFVFYMTESETCLIGCGTPLIFLTWVQTGHVLFFCPSCEGIWGQDLFFSNNPKLYSVKKFGEDTLTPSTEREILSRWQGRIITPDGEEKKYYLEELLKVFGRRLFF